MVRLQRDFFALFLMDALFRASAVIYSGSGPKSGPTESKEEDTNHQLQSENRAERAQKIIDENDEPWPY